MVISHSLTLEQKVDSLWNKAKIEKVMLNFGRALDLGDWKLYRSTFADRIHVDFERLTGNPETAVDADLWTRFAETILTPVRSIPSHIFITTPLLSALALIPKVIHRAAPTMIRYLYFFSLTDRPF